MFFFCRLYDCYFDYKSIICHFYCSLYTQDSDCGDYMPTNAEVIERLARKLERARILNDLKECQTLEEYQELTKKYETLCNDDKA